MGVFLFLQKAIGFAKQDRIGLLWLVLLISGLFFIAQLRKTKTNQALEFNLQDPQWVAVNNYLDSLSQAANQSKWEPYKFNPNYLTDYNAYLWGMSAQELARLQRFRANKQWVNSAKDFQRITQVSDSLLTVMKPFFKFPEWVNKAKSNQLKTKKQSYPEVLANLNKVTLNDLQAVRGIGPVLAKRIVDFRERYGDFADTLQLQLIYGLSSSVRNELWKHFRIQNPKTILKINFNSASASDLATIPGISFDLAVEMVSFRRLREQILDAQELLKIDGITPQKLAGIQLYLQFE